MNQRAYLTNEDLSWLAQAACDIVRSPSVHIAPVSEGPVMAVVLEHLIERQRAFIEAGS